jgi:hypothetical protein
MGGPGCSTDLTARLQRAAAPSPLLVDADDDLMQAYGGPVIWLLDGPASIGDAIRTRSDAGWVTYLLHPEPSARPDARPARYGYGDVPTLPVAAVLGAL